MKVYIGIMLGGIAIGKVLNSYIDQIVQEEKYLKYKVCTELLTSICFIIIYYYSRLSMKTMLGCTFVVFAIVLTMVDWQEMILPTSIIKWGCLIGLMERVIQSLITESWMLLVDALVGAVVGYLLFMGIFYSSQWILKKEGMGYGDVRLMAFIGLYTGLSTLFLAVLIGSLLASIYGIIRLGFHKKSEAYPLGPFLNLGGLVALIWGYEILDHSVKWLNYL